MDSEYKNNYFKGTIGALVGAILFSFLWIVVYVYAGYILSILAAVIAYGALLFYKIFGGKIGKKTSTIIVVSSLIAITVSTLVIIPVLLVNKEGYGFSLSYLNQLYSSSEFVSSLMRDYVISIVFTLLGISGVVASIRKEAYDGVSSTTSDNTTNNYIEDLNDEEQIEALRQIFAKYNAFDEKNRVPRQLILDKLSSKNKYKFLNDMKKRGIIVSTLLDRYYFSEAAVKDPELGKKNYKKFILKFIAFISIFIIIFIYGFVFDSKDSSNNENNNNSYTTKDVRYKKYEYKNISIELPETFKEYEKGNNYITLSNSNSENFNINSIVLQQFDEEESTFTEESLKAYLDNYISMVSDLSNTVKTVNTAIDGLKGYKVLGTSKETPTVHFYTYMVFSPTNTYIIIYYSDIEKNDSYNIKVKEFEDKAESLSSKIKLNDVSKG